MSIIDEARHQLDGQATTETSEIQREFDELTAQAEDMESGLRQVTEDPGAAIEAEAERALSELKNHAEQKLKAEGEMALDRAKDEAVEKGKEVAQEYAPEATKVGIEVVGRFAESAGYAGDPAKAKDYYIDGRNRLEETFGPENVFDPNAAVEKAGRDSNLAKDNVNKASGGLYDLADSALGEGTGRDIHTGLATVYEFNKVVFSWTVWGKALALFDWIKDGGFRSSGKRLPIWAAGSGTRQSPWARQLGRAPKPWARHSQKARAL